MSQIISDIQNYLTAGSIGGYVALALYGSVVLFGLIGLLKGLSRGILRQTIRSLTVALSALCSFVICQKVYPLLCDYLKAKETVQGVIEDLTNNYGLPADFVASLPEVAQKILSGLDASTFQYVLAAPLGIVILPFVFVISFVIISALMLIIHGLICAILGFKKERNNGVTRFFGMLLGLLQGAAVGALLFLPVLGITNFAAEPVKSLDEGNTARTYYEEYAEPLQNSVLADVIINKVGGKQLLTGIGTLKYNDEKIDTQALGVAVVDLVDDATALQGIDINNVTKEQEEAINAIVAKLGDKNNSGMSSLSTIVLNVVNGSVGVLQNEPSLIPMDEGKIKDLVLSFVGVFADITADTLSEDLATIAKVLYILSDNKVLANMEDPAGTMMSTAKDIDGNVMTDDKGKEMTVLSALLSTLDSNERTAKLVETLNDFAFSFIAEAAGLDGETAEIFNNVQDGIKDIANISKENVTIGEDGKVVKDEAYEAYEAEVSAQLDTVLAENGIDNLPPETQAEMGSLVAEYLVENDVSAADITPAQMAEILGTYMQAENKTEE